MIRFSIVTYNTDGILDRFVLDSDRPKLVSQAELFLAYLNGELIAQDDNDWLMRALVVVPGMGIWPLMGLRDYCPTERQHSRFTGTVTVMVRMTMLRILNDEKFGHNFLTEARAHIRKLESFPEKRDDARHDHHHQPDSNVTDLAEAVLALMEAVRVIDKAYNCVLPNALLGNLEQCQEKIRNMTVRVG